jgi:hypothetical protein
LFFLYLQGENENFDYLKQVKNFPQPAQARGQVKGTSTQPQQSFVSQGMGRVQQALQQNPQQFNYLDQLAKTNAVIDLLTSQSPLRRGFRPTDVLALHGGVQYIPGAGVAGSTQIMGPQLQRPQNVVELGGKISPEQMAQRYKPPGQSMVDFMELWKSVLRNSPQAYPVPGIIQKSGIANPLGF